MDMDIRIPNEFRRYPIWTPDHRSGKTKEEFKGLSLSWEDGPPNFFAYLCFCQLLRKDGLDKGCSSIKIREILQNLEQTENGRNYERVKLAMLKWEGTLFGEVPIFDTLLVEDGKIDALFSQGFLNLYRRGWISPDLKLAQSLGALNYRVTDFLSCLMERRGTEERVVFSWDYLAKRIGISGRYPREVACKIAGGCEHLSKAMGLNYAWEKDKVVFYLKPTMSLPTPNTTFFGCEPDTNRRSASIKMQVSTVKVPSAPTPEKINPPVEKEDLEEVAVKGNSASHTFEAEMNARGKFEEAFDRIKGLELPLAYSGKKNLRPFSGEVIANSEEFVKAFRYEFLERPPGAPSLKKKITLQDCDQAHRKITAFFQNVREIGEFDWSFFPNYFAWKKKQSVVESPTPPPPREERASQAAKWIASLREFPDSWRAYLPHGEIAKDLIVGDLLMRCPTDVIPWAELPGLLTDRSFQQGVMHCLPKEFWGRVFEQVKA